MGGYARTALLMAALTGLFVALGYALGGASGMVVAFLVAAATNFFAWWNSDAVVLRMHHAVPVGPGEHPRLHALVAELAGRAGLPMPALYVLEEDQPNAFATGRSPEHAAVAVTAGLLNTMPEEELAGVIAHELAHIRNRDTLVMTVTACLAGAIGMIARFGGMFGGMSGGMSGGRDRNSPFGAVGLILLIVLAPLAAMMVQMAISRSREYEADRAGAGIAGGPAGLANALRRLESDRHKVVNGAAEANPATAHLFIVNPLSGARFDNLFSTHPSTENRIAALAMLGPVGGPVEGAMEGPVERAGGAGAPARAARPWDRFTGRRRAGPWG